MARLLETGNASQVCREFGISRPTLNKWLKRFNPAKPSAPLRSRSTRPKSRGPRKWGEWELSMLAELDCQTHGKLSAAKLSEALLRKRIYLSRSTVGRMMPEIARKCPICKKAERVHNVVSHSFEQRMIELAATREIVRAASQQKRSEPSLWEGGTDHGHPIDPHVGCQALVRGGYRQCRNRAIMNSPFCAVHNGYGRWVEEAIRHRVTQDALRLLTN